MSKSETDHRPWGSFTVLDESTTHKVKRINVNPQQKLSLQSHRRRNETWTVVVGVAHVRVGDKESDLESGETIYIPKGTLHRLENRTDIPINVIEVQTGDYFGEDDIIRYEDLYSRS